MNVSAYSMKQIKLFLSFVLILAYSAAAEQLDQCQGSEKESYCHANGPITSGKLVEDGLPIEFVHDNIQPASSRKCLRAGVVEHSRVDIQGDCKQSTEANLAIYEKIAKIARDNGVKMLVFPEDGIYYATARGVAPCLEEIPDPDSLDEASNIPCDSPLSIYDKTPILTRLSCLAKQNDLYLVANFGTKEPCDTKRLSEDDAGATSSGNKAACPVEGRDYLMLNTNVVLDPSGKFIKRYRKWHPFTESEIFDKSPKLEHVYFDTPYGRFGLFTCFDMIYRDPAVDLVEKYHIDTAIFPTWWFDELPILTAVQYQDGWAATNGVSLLASNILKPSRGSTGSSIFSGNNSLYVTYSSSVGDSKVKKTKLLIANIAGTSEDGEQMCSDTFEPKVIEIDDNETTDAYRHRNFALLETDTFQTLDKIRDSKRLCSSDFCCNIDYELDGDTSSELMKHLVLVVRNGRRPGRFRWFEQVCALTVLKGPLSEAKEQAAYDSQNGANFLRLALQAEFQSKYVYPSTARDGRNLIDRKERRLACAEAGDAQHKSYDCRLELIPKSDGASQPSSGTKIYAFAMYGRVYELDPSEI